MQNTSPDKSDTSVRSAPMERVRRKLQEVMRRGAASAILKSRRRLISDKPENEEQKLEIQIALLQDQLAERRRLNKRSEALAEIM